MNNKLAFVFPGQGSQFVGMTKTLCDDYSVAREVFEEANDILGFNIKKLCFEGPVLELNAIENMLPALLTASYAIFRAFMDKVGLEPRYLAGHSLGEYSALVASGGLRFADALRLVRLRGSLAMNVKDTHPSWMTVVNGLDSARVEAVCNCLSRLGHTVSIACFNLKDQQVIAGSEQAITDAENELLELADDVQITPLFSSPPFHSGLLKDVSDQLRAEISKITLNDVKWPVISNVTGMPYTTSEQIITNLTEQLYKPVQWDKTMEYLSGQGTDLYIEMGPQSIMTNVIRATCSNVQAYSFGQIDDRNSVMDKFQTHHVNTPEDNQFTVITRCLAIAVCTKNNNDNNEEYETGVIMPYEKIQALQDQLEKEQSMPTKEHMEEALAMLMSVFETKRTPAELRVKRFDQIFEETGTKALFADFIYH
ncbi:MULTISPECIES: ACP S-malonyltransferase [unclassified Paenibacillus]|uniref:ACP S-malonyltransferase n=1 Tax=unclassified Paenibacillus TaxID=185978 RepID=UPI0030F509BE